MTLTHSFSFFLFLTLPVDCKVSNWSPWSACPKCGSVQLMTSTRSVTVQQKGRGAPCPALTRTSQCRIECPIDCEWTDWEPWGTNMCNGPCFYSYFKGGAYAGNGIEYSNIIYKLSYFFKIR